MQGVVQEDEGEGFNVDVQKGSRSPIPITPEMPGSGSKYIERTRIDDLASFTWDHATLVKLAKTSRAHIADYAAIVASYLEVVRFGSGSSQARDRSWSFSAYLVATCWHCVKMIVVCARVLCRILDISAFAAHLERLRSLEFLHFPHDGWNSHIHSTA
ncbi:hypothetical protein L208DRAFT_163911 [Tricholoma matsutake]|nr:hypothetical protein L208DRAFT_163911 [Tricholoma matsutake 945]